MINDIYLLHIIFRAKLEPFKLYHIFEFIKRLPRKTLEALNLL
ncbi:Hypothetical protein EUBREC_0384 [Agathobacter rectalis ATCC 33656]|uniref:Uncharacterized protein n=1 Tax=Agathobacter rectalis (strain ATCC 33656 / DSM 3377 / JCM 17463 / KCTC 5835 / VPI 0990) TaxID=515619 RepID=C4ZBA0_AGARV|nr:Hypothetical protein EUBREC_0384 [Agathobacter rectalis ATCC 33656]